MTDDRFEQMRATTQAKLQQTLLDLLADKDYDAIAVYEIAEHAGVGKMTFYRYYADKDALLKAIEDRVFAEMQALLESPPSLASSERVTRSLLHYVQDNPRLFRAVAKTAALDGIVQRLTAQALGDVNQFFPSDLSNQSEQAQLMTDLAVSHFVFAQTNLIRWWGEHDCALSVDQMVSVIFKLVMLPITNLNFPLTPESES